MLPVNDSRDHKYLKTIQYYTEQQLHWDWEFSTIHLIHKCLYKKFQLCATNTIKIKWKNYFSNCIRDSLFVTLYSCIHFQIHFTLTTNKLSLSMVSTTTLYVISWICVRTKKLSATKTCVSLMLNIYFTFVFHLTRLLTILKRGINSD